MKPERKSTKEAKSSQPKLLNWTLNDLSQRTLSYFVREILLYGWDPVLVLVSTKQENLRKIFSVTSSWIQTSQTWGQPYSDTSSYDVVSEYSLHKQFLFWIGGCLRRCVTSSPTCPHSRTENSKVLVSVHYSQCNQIWRFFALWATIQSWWQQLFYPNHPHC